MACSNCGVSPFRNYLASGSSESAVSLEPCRKRESQPRTRLSSRRELYETHPDIHNKPTCMALKISTTLKLTQLKALAFKCGVSTSGTKPILIKRLHDEITSSAYQEPSSKPKRILSIDMGIRNLAYCVLDVPLKPPLDELNASRMQLPTIQSWHRLAVSTTPAPTSPPMVAVKESFSPSTLSAAAYSLLRNSLLLQSPTHILIERQRFRSMGSKHILEWTIRVNMFESILYAVLYTLKAEGVWSGDVVGVAPGKVGPFWVGEDEVGSGVAEDGVEKEVGLRKLRNSKSAKIRNKGLKIDLVRTWLEKGDVMELGSEEMEGMAKRYVEKWDRLPGGRKGLKKGEAREDEMGKLDDLADCLLQGMAWIQWEENKKIALKSGIETLLDH